MSAFKLLDCLLKIEEDSYPETIKESVIERSNIVRKFVKQFGVDRVTVNTHTNMMQNLHSITINVFNSGRWKEGNIIIDLGSEPDELWATKTIRTYLHPGYKDVNYWFNFKTWRWNISKFKIK